MSRSGADLALLLLGGFRTMADAATAELARRGFEDVRPAHEFALRAIAAGADSSSELGRRLAVTKQAAAKTVAALEQRGLAGREQVDGRRRRKLVVTEHGLAMLREGEAIFEDLKAEWTRQVGAADIERLETILRRLVGSPPVCLDDLGVGTKTAEKTA